MSRRLFLIRHAKAVPPEESDDDFTRDLVPRGIADAQAAARLLSDWGVRPDRALVSTAARARRTWSVIGPALGDPPSVFEDGLYLVDDALLLERLRREPAVETLVLVGHNPGVKDLARRLSDGPGPHAAGARARLAAGFPTAWCAALAVDDDLTLGQARLIGAIGPETL